MGSVRLSWVSAVLLVISTLLLILQFAQPPAPESLRPKIFVIGFSKTGSTSIGDALGQLGYRRLGWRDIRSRHMVHAWANKELESLVELTRYYDAFEDLPWPLMYREMAELYPDAKFVLSLRADEDTWLRSMRTHVGRGKWLPYTYFYGADTMEGNENIIVQSYRNHTEQVRHYFRDRPERYVELNIDNGDTNWHVLCRIAQCPGGKTPSLGFPKSNTAASWNAGFWFESTRWWWLWAVTRLEEQASHYYYNSGRNHFKPALGACWVAYDVVERACTALYFQIMPVVSPPLTAMARI